MPGAAGCESAKGPAAKKKEGESLFWLMRPPFFWKRGHFAFAQAAQSLPGKGESEKGGGIGSAAFRGASRPACQGRGILGKKGSWKSLEELSGGARQKSGGAEKTGKASLAWPGQKALHAGSGASFPKPPLEAGRIA
jgi:hypothetical protein